MPAQPDGWCSYSDCPDGQLIERLYECEAHSGNPREGFHSASQAADFLPMRDQALLNNACSAGWLPLSIRKPASGGCPKGRVPV